MLTPLYLIVIFQVVSSKEIPNFNESPTLKYNAPPISYSQSCTSHRAIALVTAHGIVIPELEWRRNFVMHPLVR
ncbi:hypothetical protein BGX38DRAFT_1166581 [Terfezia claveryi]|nr:hypothetical protein BGX38DRAFT_1166581 [Terfezia claveryi]